MRSALRDAEVTPPADGWARLERELKTPAPRISVLRRYWPRIAAAAAAVLIFVGGGELLLHENRSLGDKGFVIASATDGGSSAADNRTYPAGGIGTLEESLRAVVPSQEAVQTESLPGREAQARQAVRAAYPATAVARNAAPAVVAVDVTDSRPQPAPENEAAATLRSEETIAQKQAAAETSGVQERTAPKENAASARTYPSTTSYYGDQIAFEQPKSRRRTSVSLFAAGSVTGGGTVSAGPGPGMMMSDAPVGGGAGTMAQLKYNYDDYSFKHHQPLSFGLSVRKEFAHGLSLESGVNYTLLWAEVQPAGYQSETPFYRRAAAYELAVSGYGALLAVCRRRRYDREVRLREIRFEGDGRAGRAMVRAGRRGRAVRSGRACRALFRA